MPLITAFIAGIPINRNQWIRYYEYAFHCTGWLPMGIDRPDVDDTPVAATAPDTRDAFEIIEPDLAIDIDRDKFHLEYRAKVDAVYVADARERWEAARLGLEREWREYTHDHPAPPVASPDIDREARNQIERGCKDIWETEENIVTPAMILIEAEDPERHLIGLERRCKGEDRITEKVAAALAEQPTLTPGDALASVKDAIRYTLQYTEQHYTEGVYADLQRLKSAGFEQVDLRNSWASEEYKGINSRWRVPEKAQLFEVQFHTQASFEAKHLTHQAYERIRGSSTTKAEQDVLVDFHRRVNSYVPEPQRAREIPAFP